MTEKLGIIAGVVAFLGFSLFCAWHHATPSNTHHSAETPLASTAGVPPTTSAIVPPTTTPVTEVPATALPLESVPQTVQLTTPALPPQSPEPMQQEQPSLLPPAPGLRSKVVEFYADSDIVTPKGRETLNAVLPLLRGTSMTRLEIAGHTDAVGPKEYNLALSQRRADAVKNYFLAQGVAEQSLVAQGYGSSLPIADNATAEGRQRNRRTEVIVHLPVAES